MLFPFPECFRAAIHTYTGGGDYLPFGRRTFTEASAVFSPSASALKCMLPLNPLVGRTMARSNPLK